MLARPFRLRRSADIARVYRRGSYAGGALFQVKTSPSGWPNSRAAIVVSRKVARSAVVRNKTRRRLSGQLERLWERIRPGYDIVISVRQDLGATPADQLAAELAKHLARLELLTDTTNV